MTITNPRAFSIFVDDAPPAPTTRKLSTSSTSRAPSRGATPPPVDKENKENAKPLSAKDKNGSGTLKGSLKRKTGVLETKLYVPPTSKKARDESRPVLKRRAVSVPLLDTTEFSAPLPKPKVAKAPKAGPSTSSNAGSAAPVKKKTRRPKVSVSMSLPSVVEEEPVASSSFSMSQAAIDGRCYDLTVSPLADVSEAYDAFGESQLVEDEDEDNESRSSRITSSTASHNVHITLPTPSSSKSSMETQLRDYFAEPVLGVRTSSSSSKPRPLSRAVSLPAQAFGWSSEPSPFDDAFFARDSTLSTLNSLSSLSSLPSLADEESVVLDSLESSPEIGTPPPAGGLHLQMTTPERKSVYAAFTFSTPSPTTTTRTNLHCRSTSLDRFGDIAFVPVI